MRKNITMVIIRCVRTLLRPRLVVKDNTKTVCTRKIPRPRLSVRENTKTTKCLGLSHAFVHHQSRWGVNTFCDVSQICPCLLLICMCSVYPQFITFNTVGFTERMNYKIMIEFLQQETVSQFTILILKLISYYTLTPASSGQSNKKFTLQKKYINKSIPFE